MRFSISPSTAKRATAYDCGSERDAREAGDYTARRVRGAEQELAPVEHLQQLDLHRREGGERPAHAGAQEGAAVGADREPLLQARDEVAEEEAADDVDGKDRPRPMSGLGGRELDEPGPDRGSQGAAGEDSG
jgi:hypothetical protein